jgi:hypothetical protein
MSGLGGRADIQPDKEGESGIAIVAERLRVKRKPKDPDEVVRVFIVGFAG